MAGKAVALAIGVFLLLAVTGARSAEGTALAGLQSVVPLQAQCSNLGGMPAVVIEYKNNLTSALDGVVYAVVHNAVGQTVYYTTASLSLPADAPVTAYPILAGLARGNYSVDAFTVTPSGVVISPKVTIQCSVTNTGRVTGDPQTLSVTQGPLCSSGPGCPSIQIVYRNNLNRTVTGVVSCVVYEQSSWSNPTYRSAATISFAAGQSMTVNLFLPGLLSGFPPYYYIAEVYVLSGSGTALSVTSFVQFG